MTCSTRNQAEFRGRNDAVLHVSTEKALLCSKLASKSREITLAFDWLQITGFHDLSRREFMTALIQCNVGCG